MTDIHIIMETGSHRLIERDGKFAIVEYRDGQIFAPQRSASEGAPDTPQGVATVTGPEDWTDRETAEARWTDVTNRGEDLARTIW